MSKFGDLDGFHGRLVLQTHPGPSMTYDEFFAFCFENGPNAMEQESEVIRRRVIRYRTGRIARQTFPGFFAPDFKT